MKSLSTIAIIAGCAAGLLHAFDGNVAFVIFDCFVTGVCIWCRKEW